MITLLEIKPGTGMSYNSFFTCIKCGFEHIGSSSDRICVNCEGN